METDRDATAGAVGISRGLAAFHLDRLAEAGLLEVQYRRRSGRAGPGAGRPAKFYRRAADGVELSLPPRRYEAAARLMAQAIARAGGSAQHELLESARQRGAWLARRARRLTRSTETAALRGALARVLEEEGFEPRSDSDSVTLGNCPYRALARANRAVTCGMNLALIESLAGELPEARLAAERVEPDGSCCVRLSPAID
ncbi:MAG TPA: transcriptional regulator [Candidatus Limnocylindria bacterium]|nr:transcriptional regulator [Candidatus Limnocylindria bacterium]